jgi:hypothetical protein
MLSSKSSYRHSGSDKNIGRLEMLYDARCSRCEACFVAKFCFHAVGGLGDGSVVRSAAAFLDSAECKPSVSSAQGNRAGCPGRFLRWFHGSPNSRASGVALPSKPTATFPQRGLSRSRWPGGDCEGRRPGEGNDDFGQSDPNPIARIEPWWISPRGESAGLEADQ